MQFEKKSLKKAENHRIEIHTTNFSGEFIYIS